MLKESQAREERDRLYSLLETVLETASITDALRIRIEQAMRDIDARHVVAYNDKLAKKEKAHAA